MSWMSDDASIEWGSRRVGPPKDGAVVEITAQPCARQFILRDGGPGRRR